jgi:hypothetical protein
MLANKTGKQRGGRKEMAKVNTFSGTHLRAEGSNMPVHNAYLHWMQI